MTTLYEKLLAEFDDERLRANKYHSTIRSTRVAFARNGAEQPELAGLGYTVDYKSEEEYGVGDVRRAVTGNDKRHFQMIAAAADNIGYFEDVNALVISSRGHYGEAKPLSWGDSVGYQMGDVPDYVLRYEHSLSYMQGSKVEHPERARMADLRELANGFGLTGPLPRSKKGLADHITQNVPATDLRENPDQWPAWFQNGQDLVMRADDGPAALVLEHLRAAARAGTLGIGSSSGPFSSSIFFYDTADETDLLKAEREIEFDWYDEQMAPIAAVKADLESDGHTVWFLGKPQPKSAGSDEVQYWLNTSPRLGKQISGWFSLAKLRSRDFVKGS